MKRKATVLALMLTFVLSFGAFQTVFAGYPDFTTFKNLETDSVSEVAVEEVALALYNQTIEGGYSVMGTGAVQGLLDDPDAKFVLVDTMPAGWYAGRHIPGAINQVVGGGAENGPAFNFQEGEADALLEKVAAACGTKEVIKKTTKSTKYYWNSKTKSWTTKKPAAKYWKKCTKKSDKYYGKKTKTVKKTTKKTVTVPNKDVTIICYCGFVKCQRSHQAAKFLVENGYTDVYRYPAGISGWLDAGLPMEDGQGNTVFE
jgi:rhodanese-related sulfurtransferase